MQLVHAIRDDYDFYIGREDSRIGEKQSPFHNPYKSEGFGGKPWAIELFRAYFVQQLRKGKLQRKHLERLKGKRVACWCNGNCHGLVLKQFTQSRERNFEDWIRQNSFSTYIIEMSDGTVKHKKRLHTIKAADFGHGAVLYGLSRGTMYPLFEAKSSLFSTDWHPHPEYKVDFR